MILNNHRPKRRDDLLKRDVEDGLVMYDRNTSEIFTLNTTAALIWEYCDNNTSIEEIAQELSTTCNLIKEDMLRDIKKIVADFQEKGLLETESEKHER